MVCAGLWFALLWVGVVVESDGVGYVTAQSAEAMKVAVESVVGLRVWWLWAEVGGFGLLWKRDRWLLVEVMGLGCCGRGIGGCGFGVEEGLMAMGWWWVRVV